MLISYRFLSVLIICIHSAVSSGIQDDVRVNRRNSKQLQEEKDTYKYNHPPLSEIDGTPSTLKHTEARGTRKQKAVDIKEETPSVQNRTRVRTVRRRARPSETTRSNVKIPVKVIYDAEPTTLRSTLRPTTNPQKEDTKRASTQRNRQEQSLNKRVDIREVKSDSKNRDRENVVQNAPAPPTERNNDSGAAEFPKRSRESFFRKQAAYRVPEPKVKIVEEKNFVYAHTGNFHYSFEGTDGTKVWTKGELKSTGNDKPGEAISGSVFYKDKDGNDVNLSYTADENGYRPVGAHLPTPPPIPDAIARALKYIAEKNKSTTPNSEP